MQYTNNFGKERKNSDLVLLNVLFHCWRSLFHCDPHKGIVSCIASSVFNSVKCNNTVCGVSLSGNKIDIFVFYRGVPTQS